MANIDIEKYEALKAQLERENSKGIKTSKTKNITVERKSDGLTGELLEEHTSVQTVTKIGSEPPFVKMYLNDLSQICNLRPNDNSILMELVNLMDFNNEINLNPRLKKKICSSVGCQMQSLNNTLGRLVKKDILIRLEPGSFLMNPFFFGRGTWDNIARIRMTIDYKGNRREIKVDIQNEEIKPE